MNDVKIITDPDTFKVSSIEYVNRDIKKEIEVFVSIVTKCEDKANIGSILEEYRKRIDDHDEYYAINKAVLENFVDSVEPAFIGFIPDHIISFLPADANRRALLNAFSKKVQNADSAKPPVDFSDCFCKTDSSRSIKNGLTANDYELRLAAEFTSIRNLLIIDDVIDKGDTVRIFLDKLFATGKFVPDAIIKMACIYNNRKMEKKDVMGWFKAQQKSKFLYE